MLLVVTDFPTNNLQSQSSGRSYTVRVYCVSAKKNSSPVNLRLY